LLPFLLPPKTSGMKERVSPQASFCSAKTLTRSKLFSLFFARWKRGRFFGGLYHGITVAF